MARFHRLIRQTASVTAALLLLHPVTATAQSADDVQGEVVLRALALVRAPYRYGGRTPAGFDCSGFVGYVFSETAGVALPRRSEEMSRLGESLSSDHWAAGDLVFFNTLGRPYSHVGIYVGDGRFIHAPARRGRVRVESIADPYWAVRFNGARRLFPAAIGTAPATTAASAPASALEALEARITP